MIGGGLGGLAAACTLAARGYRVIVFEKNEWLGGKAAVLEEGGYRFDMGPTILLMPSVLKRLFAEAGRELDDELDLLPLDPQWRSFFDDGSTLDLHADRRRMIGEIETFGRAADPPGDTADSWTWPGGSTRSRTGISSGVRSAASATCSTPRRPSAPRRSPTSLRMRPWSTVGATIRSFVADRRVAQMLDHFTQYVGSAPDLSPAVLCGIAHMQTGEGVWYPRGGTRAVAEALIRLARELGVELRTGADVREIALDEDGGAVGSRDRRRPDDPPGGRRLQLGRRPDPSRAAAAACRHRGSSSGGGATSRPVPGSSSTWDWTVATITCCTTTSSSPAIRTRSSTRSTAGASRRPIRRCYLVCAGRDRPGRGTPAAARRCMSSSMRPTSGRVTTGTSSIPAIVGRSWRSSPAPPGLDDLEARIRVERRLTPRDIHERYRVLDGAIYGLASHGRLNGAFKPANRSPDVPGLYLAGGAAHPGPGMPMVLMSGWIAADALDRDAIVEPARAVSGVAASTGERIHAGSDGQMTRGCPTDRPGSSGCSAGM